MAAAKVALSGLGLVVLRTLRMEPTPSPVTFIVRLTLADGGVLSGIVERVRGGEKRRFHGAAALADVIAEMAGREAGGHTERER